MTKIQKPKAPMPSLLKNLEPRQTDKIQGGLTCRKSGGDQQEY